MTLRKGRNIEKLIVTPKTKIFDLLEAYPELEDLLISMAPEFVKLKNPLLRKTFAPFIPAPLPDKSLSLGYRHWLERKQEGEYRVYFIK